MKTGPSPFDRIKRRFDPAYGYVVFERSAGSAGDGAFRDVIEILGRLQLKCHERWVYHDESDGRDLLVVRLDPGPTDGVMVELFHAGLPDDVVFFVYGGSRPQ